MGVPITALDKLDPEIFEIVGILGRPAIGEKTLYTRLLIRRREDHREAGGALREAPLR